MPKKPSNRSFREPDKIWFDDTCKKYYKILKFHLFEGNECKSVDNRNRLADSKKIYKSHCKRVKRAFMNTFWCVVPCEK